MQERIFLLKHQQEFADATETEVIMLGDGGAGKTFVQLHDMVSYALNNPESKQVYMCNNPMVINNCYGNVFEANAKYSKIKAEYMFENGSRVILSKYDDKHILMNCSLCLEVYRIDVDFFNMPMYIYFKRILPRVLRPSKYKTFVKITAEDASYRLINKMIDKKVIEASYIDNPFLDEIHMPAKEKEFEKRIYGEWDNGGMLL